MQPDFSRLYRELGLQPDCSLDVFRQAYRRLVSVQHPDRPDARMRADGALALPDLISLHDQALQFHRRHGRLPGSSVVAKSGSDGSDKLAAWPEARRSVSHRMPRSARDAPSPAVLSDRGPVSRNFMIALAAAALVLIAISLSQTPDPRDPARPVAARKALPAKATADKPLQLAIGMDAATVRSIQGEPMHIRANDWDYGPSWLKFKRGKLVDWYSSPLRQLKAPTSVPVIVATQPQPASLDLQ